MEGDQVAKPKAIIVPPHPTKHPRFPPDVTFDPRILYATIRLELKRIKDMKAYYKKVGNSEAAKKYEDAKVIVPLRTAFDKADESFFRALFG